MSDQTVLDKLFGDHAVTGQLVPVAVQPDELAHVVGTQEPVRDHPDDRARILLAMGWLKVQFVKIDLPDSERAERVANLQRAARAWLKESPGASQAKREQVRWLVEKTRPHESKQQITQRVWLALALFGLGFRGFRFDAEGQIFWDSGLTGRIGIGPDAALDLAWSQPNRQLFVASFREPEGTIARGKGRQRWHIYQLAVDSAAKPLFERYAKQSVDKVALIVASDIHASQPQLPRDFYGGDAFQQACIDAQDQRFDHMLVLSPEHGVLSLDDTVPSEKSWDYVINRSMWLWQSQAVRRLGKYLFGNPDLDLPDTRDLNWWAWLNPNSQYHLTIFGGGFVVRILLDNLLQMRTLRPAQLPNIILEEYRPGYQVGDYDSDFDGPGSDFDLEEDDDLLDKFGTQAAMEDIDQLLEWSTDFAAVVNIHVIPTNEVWELAPDEALIPVRLLTEMGMDIEDLLDLLTDISLLMEQSISLSMLINASMIVSVLLQIAHTLVHNERGPAQEILNAFPETSIRQYVETAMQEAALEDQLCACLTLAEQMQLLAMAVPDAIGDQLLVWLQTYISTRMRQRLLGDEGNE